MGHGRTINHSVGDAEQVVTGPRQHLQLTIDRAVLDADDVIGIIAEESGQPLKGGTHSRQAIVAVTPIDSKTAFEGDALSDHGGIVSGIEEDPESPGHLRAILRHGKDG